MGLEKQYGGGAKSFSIDFHGSFNNAEQVDRYGGRERWDIESSSELKKKAAIKEFKTACESCRHRLDRRCRPDDVAEANRLRRELKAAGTDEEKERLNEAFQKVLERIKREREQCMWALRDKNIRSRFTDRIYDAVERGIEPDVCERLLSPKRIVYKK